MKHANDTHRAAASNAPMLLVGNRSTGRVSGATLGFDLVVDGLAERGVPHRVIDRGRLGAPSTAGSFNLVRGLRTLGLIAATGARMVRCRGVYLVIASSRAGFLRDMLMIWAASLLRRRIVMHLFGGGYGRFYQSQPGSFQRIIRGTLRRADVLIVEGDLLRGQFEFLGERRPRIYVVPNALPADAAATTSNAPVEPNRRPPHVRLLYLSNMIPSKGYRIVLQVCRILRYDIGRPVRCDFAGAFVSTSEDGGMRRPAENEKAFQGEVAALGLDDCVEHHGVVRGVRKGRLLADADFFLLPTRYPWEGQPISIIEALASGTPIIAPAYRGIPELVEHGFNGFLIDPKHPERMAAAIDRTLKIPAEYARLSANAREHFEANFTRERHMAGLMPLILGKAAPTGPFHGNGGTATKIRYVSRVET